MILIPTLISLIGVVAICLMWQYAPQNSRGDAGVLSTMLIAIIAAALAWLVWGLFLR